MRHSWRVTAPFMAVMVALAFARCDGGDSSACDACIDVTPTPLVVALTPAEIWVHPGDAKAVAVALARGPGGDGDVTVKIDGDAGFAADALTISATQTQGTLVVHAPASFNQGDTTLTITAATASASATAPLIVHVAGASGTLDATFGNAGIADLAPSAGQDFARALVALQSGVLVGATHVETDSTMKVLRLTGSGGVDSSFTVTTTPGELFSLATLPNGQIFAIGDVRDTKANFAAVRILAAGGLDPTYAVTTAISLGEDIAYAGAVEPGGRLVAAGSAADASAIALARYTQVPLPVPDAGAGAADASDADASDANASDASDADAAEAEASPITSHLDPSFGDGGVVVTPLNPSAAAYSLLVASDGSLYALGVSSTNDIVVAHYGTSGALDTSFGDAGTVSGLGGGGVVAALLDPKGNVVFAQAAGAVFTMSPTGAILGPSFGLTGGVSTVTSIARDAASGKILLGGFSGAPHQCLVARFDTKGALDTTFANAGTLLVSQGDSCDVAALAVDEAGKIVVLESITTGGLSHMAVARYWP